MSASHDEIWPKLADFHYRNSPLTVLIANRKRDITESTLLDFKIDQK